MSVSSNLASGSVMVPVVLKADIRVFRKQGSKLLQTGHAIQSGKEIQIGAGEEIEYDHRTQSAAPVLNFEFPDKNPETAYVLLGEYQAATK